MSRPRRLVTVADASDVEVALASQLAARGDVELVMRCLDRVELLAALRGAEADAAVFVGVPEWCDRETLLEAAHHPVVLVAMLDDPQDVARAASVGMVVVPTDVDVDRLLELCDPGSIDQGVENKEPSPPTGALTVVWGPKGAPGRSTVALEVAMTLAAGQARTLLVDADTYGADLRQLAGVVEELPGIVWACRHASEGNLDWPLIVEHLRRVGDEGPLLLGGLARSERWSDVTPFGWRELLVTCKSLFRHTICDVGFCLEPGSTGAIHATERNRMARETLLRADHVIAICRADPVGLKQFVWGFDDLAEIVDTSDILVVANWVSAGAEAEIEAVLKKHLSKRVAVFVPEASDDLARAHSIGRTLFEHNHRSAFAESIRELAACLGGRVPARGVLARLAGKVR